MSTSSESDDLTSSGISPPNMDEHWALRPGWLPTKQWLWLDPIKALYCDRAIQGGKIAPLMWIAHLCPVWAAVGEIWNEIWNEEKEKPDVFAMSARSYSQDRWSRKSFGRARTFAHKLKLVFLIVLLLLVWLSIEEPVKSYNIMRIQSRRFTFREKRSHLDNLL